MDVAQFAKENWPILVGGTVGLFLIMRMRGGGGSAAPAPVIMNTAPSDASIMASAQADAVRQQAALATQQMNMQNNQQMALIQLERDKIGASTAATNAGFQLERDKINATVGMNNSTIAAEANKNAMAFALQQGALEVQAQANTNAARTANITAAGGFLQAQGTAAGAAGTAVAQMVGQLQAPAVMALQTASYENAAALNAAAVAATSTYQAQSATFSGITDVLKEFVKTPAAVMGSMPAAANGGSLSSLFTGFGNMAGGFR